MAERKVLNKYIPPDFDPDKLMECKKLMRKIEKKKNRNKYNKNKKNFLNIRMMYPFTLKCNKCKSFTYVGTKFNSRVEKVRDENYLNIPIWKFYGKCSECKNELIFKTDPKNGDYVLIAGGTRTYDAHKEQELADDFYRTNENGEEEDKIKNTEKESYNALLELKTNEQLEELQNINKRHIDKFNSINKALNRLYEKNEIQNSENRFYMNSLDPEDEKAFFNLLSKSRSSTDKKWDRINRSQTAAPCSSNVIQDNIIIEEEELGDVLQDESEEEQEAHGVNKAEEETVGGETVQSTSKGCSISKKKEMVKNIEQIEINNLRIKKNIKNDLDDVLKPSREGKINDNNSSVGENTNFNRNSGNHTNFVSDISRAHGLKNKNLEKNYNFVIKKKENLSSIFNEYNTDSSDNPDRSDN
ncbi:conserved protein, unknown function [Plasmodium ovale wallikeri]|uniref:CWC16 domain-containing protein n=2 Tax=Plasmodium ovale TaxID=36330 RepID=A0A1A9A2J4_PLAOA|nr:conserved protein, unknown function [Plasmodium ovale wallikeri]SBT50659.1 conserved protein, unknown function [Plasmodium ovale wallikeri]SBT76719.1 conserved protein, unknown function [Plasmodium ovale]